MFAGADVDVEKSLGRVAVAVEQEVRVVGLDGAVDPDRECHLFDLRAAIEILARLAAREHAAFVIELSDDDAYCSVQWGLENDWLVEIASRGIDKNAKSVNIGNKRVSMDIVITQWGLDSYLDLKHRNVFSANDYRTIIRPAVLLLKQYQSDPKFQQNGFWSPASGYNGVVRGGFKMKWHNLGPGTVQLRLGVGLINDTAYLCDAYVKSNASQDMRMMTKLEGRLDVIRQNKHIERGRL